MTAVIWRLQPPHPRSTRQRAAESIGGAGVWGRNALWRADTIVNQFNVWNDAGVYQAEWDSAGRLSSTGIPLATAGLIDSFDLWVGIDRRQYIHRVHRRFRLPRHDHGLDREFHYTEGISIESDEE